MKIHKFQIVGSLLIIPKVFSDSRGFFLETFRHNAYDEILGVEFVQDNMSFSHYGTIRGLHFQKNPYAQTKLVRCVYGKILDVAVDIRQGSPSYGKYIHVFLDNIANHQLLIPKGFAHGFSVLSREAVVEYKCDEYFHSEADAGIRFDDPYLSIDWQVPERKRIISAKDIMLPTLSEIETE